jgi:excisionase family DNA binding protein
MKRILLTSEVADILRISEGYLRELIRKGKIKAYKEGRRGGYRIREEEVEKYVKNKHND